MIEYMLVYMAGVLTSLTGAGLMHYLYSAPRTDASSELAPIAPEGDPTEPKILTGQKCNVRIFRFQGGDVALHPICKGVALEQMDEAFARRQLRGALRVPGRLIEVMDQIHYV